MRKLLISSALIAGFMFMGCQQTTSSNNTMSKSVKVTGIREASLNAGSQNLPVVTYKAPAPIPGKVKLIPTSFVTAPPMIPHSIKGMVPIKVGKNECLACHMPSAAKAMGVVPMPKDHFVDNFDGDKKQPKVAGSRYFCTTCHAPQANVEPAVENKFESLKAQANLK